MKKEIKRAISAFFALILIFAALPFSRAEAKSFPDVSQDDWFYDDVTELAKWEIINGYPDGTFDPNNTLSRGEFIHMAVMCCEGVWSDKPLANVHWAEIDWNALKDAGILEVSVYSGTDSGGNVKETMQPLFECTAAELNKPISRYEVAYIINGLLYS